MWHGGDQALSTQGPTVRVGGVQTVLEGEPFVANEASHRVVAHHRAALGQLGPKGAAGQVWCCGDLGQQPVALIDQHATAAAASRHGRLLA